MVELSAGPFVENCGIRIVNAQDGRAVLEADFRSSLTNPNGVLHGGVAFTMADTSMGAALTTVLEAGERCTAVEIKINFLKAVTEGKLICETKVVSKKRRLAFLESGVTDEKGSLVAKATGTFYILKNKG